MSVNAMEIVEWYDTLKLGIYYLQQAVLTPLTSASPLVACPLSYNFSCWADPWIRWDKRTSFPYS